MKNTKTLIAGTVVGNFTYSHEICGEKFYRGAISVERASGTEDIVPVVTSEYLFDANLDYAGKFIFVTGEFRSRNIHYGNKSSLDLFVFASSVEEPIAATYMNSISLDGYVCKVPVYRKTPLGREICDLLVAVNASFGRNYYIPCICWGRKARFAGDIAVGEKIRLFGRIQSREYRKELKDGSHEMRIAYEVSANKVELIGNEVK